MRIAVATGRQDSRQFAKTVRALLEALTMAARTEVAIVGPLYSSGVVYGEEPPDEETFASPFLVNERGWGDCAHLCLWRVAELRNSGVPATYDVWIQAREVKRTFHVRVRLPDGTIEDPSQRLGMKVPKGLVMPS